MATRLFLQQNFDHKTPDAIIAIDESDIQDTVSSYGFYIKSNDTLSDDYFQQNPDGTFSIDPQDVPNWIDKIVDGKWDFSKLLEAQKNDLIQASNFEMDHSEEANSSEVWEIEFNQVTGFAITTAEATVIGQHYTYWDGHNWKKVELTSDCYDTQYTEVTDQYPNFEEMEQIGEKNARTGGMKYFAHKNEDGSYILIEKEWSLYQSTQTTYRTLTGDEAIEALICHCYSEDVKKYFEGYLNKAIEVAQKDLKNGETLAWDDEYTLVFKYRSEEYHFTHEQVLENLSFSIREAREAIRTRRIEAVTEKLAKNNYAGVFTLPLNRIFVERTDSITAGNCEEYTDQLIVSICQNEGIAGSFALRADKLLQYRDDNYSRRAILQAYRAGHIQKIA